MFTVVCVCMCAVLCVVHAWSVMYVLCVLCACVWVFFGFFCFFLCVYNTSVVMPSIWSLEGYPHPPHCHCTSDL